MNKIVLEKASIIIELCQSITQNLVAKSSDEFYKKYDIPVTGYGTSFTINLNNCYYEQRILYNGELIDLNISKIRNWKTNEKEIIIRLKNSISETNIEEEQLSAVLSEAILNLKESAIEHEYKKPSEETIQILKELCSKDVTILLHGTDFSKVKKILEEGLKIWDIGQACRTTAMINNDYAHILAYNYADKCFRPRNIIFAIPKLPLPPNSSQKPSDKRSMEKCKKCTARIFNNYDGWCFKENYIYECIACQTDIGWVIPPEYIYGYMDYNGNFVFNEKYNPALDETQNQYLLKKKLHLN